MNLLLQNEELKELIKKEKNKYEIELNKRKLEINELKKSNTIDNNHMMKNLKLFSNKSPDKSIRNISPTKNFEFLEMSSNFISFYCK